MAAPAGQLRTGRYFAALLAIIAILYSLVFLVGSESTPRLGLDLVGGTTVTLTAETADGQPPTADSLEQARQIIERRVNGIGVAEAEVVVEGDSNIIISVPGEEGEQAKQLGETAQLRFRPVVQGPIPAGSDGALPTDTAVPTETAAPTDGTDPSADPGTTVGPDDTAAPTTATPAPDGRALPPLEVDSDDPVTTTEPTEPAEPTDSGTEPIDSSGSQEEAAAALATLDCAELPIGATPEPSDAFVAACSQDGAVKYLLGPTIIEGTEIGDANAVLDSQSLQGWTIALDFRSAAQRTWATYTTDNVGSNVGFTLDGRVISAPTIQGPIPGQTQITGDFTEEEARDLANSLKYGSLPLTFSQSEARTVSATLGLDQLQAGLIAGGIGVALVFIYTLIYYRLLGLVTIASLILSGVVVYAVLVVLGRQIGFTLTLAGVAGFIVAIGITADSFVVFFERIKDEVGEGRSMRSAVPRAWIRARRTILSADAVSFLAAASLYFLAIGEVKGFAFTLGLSTILDLVVVFLFTHPVVSLLSRREAFSSPRVSGLGGMRPPTSDVEPSSGARERAAARRRQMAASTSKAGS